MASNGKKILRLDGNFVAKVERLASGGVAGVGARYRTRRTTLEDIAKEIVIEAERITDLPARDGGGRDRGGLPGGREGYAFRKEVQAGGRRYKNSFNAEVTKKSGRLVVVAWNKHPYAGDVEYGNRRLGSRIFGRGGNYLALPITKAKYDKMQKSRNLSRAERRAKGWASASSEYQQDYRKRSKLRKQYGEEMRTRGIAFKRRGSSKSFAKLDASGKAWLFTRSVRTRDGYKIMRRAFRNVVRRKFR